MYGDFWRKDSCNEICGDGYRQHAGVYVYNDWLTMNWWSYTKGNQCDDG